MLLEVHEKYFPQVYRYFDFRIGEPELCEALSSQVFVHLVNALQKEPDVMDRLEEWLFKNANELANASLRSNKGNRKSVSRQPKPVILSPTNETNDQLSWLGMIIHQSLLHLTFEQQHILALRFTAGMSAEEISNIFGRTTAEIRGTQYEALELMRRYLEEAS